MELKGERLIPADQARTWAALNDPEVLKACIAGCEALDRTGDDSYQALVAVRVGPVSARFKGRLQLSDVNPPTSYTLAFDGQGGVAGFGKGSAQVTLAPEGEAATRLSYHAHASVGGKIAQLGSRLVDSAAAKVAADFFDAFEAYLSPATAAAEDAEGAPAATATAATAATVRKPAAPAPATNWLPWALAAVFALLALSCWLTR